MDEEAGAFDFHSHIGDHSLDHFKGSDGFAELDADFGVFTAGAESRFGNADGNGADERTGSVQGIHGDTGGMAEMIAILQSAHDDAGEDVAGARELNGDFFVGQEEILFCKMIETYHGMLTLYDA